MVKIEEELKNIQDTLRRLKIEYQIFFNGNRKKPPEDIRLRLERASRQLSDRSDMTQAQRFRYNTLLTRYYTYRNMWRRVLQERENGTGPPGKTSPKQQHLKNKPAVEKHRISLTDPKAEEDKVRNLYDTLMHCKMENSEEFSIQFRQFAKYVESQTQNIRRKFKCTNVTYTIALDGDEIRFTATAEKPGC